MTMPFNKFALNKWVDEKLVTTTSAAPLHFQQLEKHMKATMDKLAPPLANKLKPLAVSVNKAIQDAGSAPMLVCKPNIEDVRFALENDPSVFLQQGKKISAGKDRIVTLQITKRGCGDKRMGPYMFKALEEYVKGVQSGSFGNTAEETVEIEPGLEISSTVVGALKRCELQLVSEWFVVLSAMNEPFFTEGDYEVADKIYQYLRLRTPEFITEKLGQKWQVIGHDGHTTYEIEPSSGKGREYNHGQCREVYYDTLEGQVVGNVLVVDGKAITAEGVKSLLTQRDLMYTSHSAEMTELKNQVVVLCAHISNASHCETEEEVIHWQEHSKALIDGVPKQLTDRFEGRLQMMSAQIELLTGTIQEYWKWSNQLIAAIANDTAKGPALTALRELNRKHH